MMCENCGVRRDLPPHLWKRVHYGNRVKVVCPTCYEWARNHPEVATVVR